jgi:RNA polymerase-binding transcription factor DksA
MKRSELRRLERRLKIHRVQALTSLKRTDGTEFVDQDYAKNISESLFRLCKDINAALARMQKGTYGVCVACGDEIGLCKLEALAWAQYCLRCQLSLEQQGASGKLIQGDGPRGNQIEPQHGVRP